MKYVEIIRIIIKSEETRRVMRAGAKQKTNERKEY